MAKLLSGTRVVGSATIDTQLIVLGTATSTSTTTGALVVNGGVGIGGDLRVGGTIFGAISGTSATATSVLTVARTGNATHFLTFVDANNPIATAESLYTTSSVIVNPTTGEIDILSTLSSTSTTTGALVVTGGVGIGGNLRVGGTIFGTISGIITTATNIAGGTTGQLVYQSAPGITAFVSTGTAGQILISGGAAIPVYTSTTTVYVGRAVLADSVTNIAGGAANQIHIQTGTGVTGFIVAPTTASTYLQWTGSAFTWGSIAAGGVTSITAGTDTAISTSTGAITIWNTSTLQSITNRGAATTNAVNITNISSATSTATGALVVTGGAGIGGNLYVGGTIFGTISGGGGSSTATTILTTARTSTASHFLTFVDSNNTTATAETLYTTSSITVNPTTGEIDILSTLSSTSTTTGALVVTGGVGVGGSVYVGNRVGWSDSTGVSRVYQFYNTLTNSLDTIFG